jgi:hypothetical protein
MSLPPTAMRLSSGWMRSQARSAMQIRQSREARRAARDAFYAELLTPTEGDGEPPPF